MAKNKKTPEEVTQDYERRQLQLQLNTEAAAVSLYQSTINQIASLASIQNMPSGVFTLSKLRTLEYRIDTLISQLNTHLEVFVKSGINDAWQLSNYKNDYFADVRLNKSLIPTNKRVVFYDTNKPALEAFKERQVNGLNLSERIYETGQVFKSELEAGIGIGIGTGQSAAELGRNLRQYLKNPDMLFRRVRDEEGTLQLSQNAKAFHPGQGVYRSSTANIQRLTRTEINTAYRTADNTRWQQMPFLLGQEIHVSGSHPRYDVCDILQGDYPTEFIFIGWHPQCICFTVPKLMSDEQFAQYQKLVLAGTDTPANILKIGTPISEIPTAATDWMKNNAERISGWKNPPLWMQQNQNFVPSK